jgi:ribosomal protein S1
MSTPETPPQNPTTPVASDEATPPAEPSAAPVDASSNGKREEAAGASAEESAREDAESAEGNAQEDVASTSEGQQENAAPPAAAGEPAGGEKRRRRRRRKKKPGSHVAGDGGTSEPPEQGADAAASEAADGAAPAPPGDGQHLVEPAAEAQRSEKRDPKKKEKRHGPPRERPPVNLGDIVFGKILEITDEAIIVDIPGKAHAIFDRLEMLLPDDDDPRRPPPRAPAIHEPAPDEPIAPETMAGDAGAAPPASDQPTPPTEAAPTLEGASTGVADAPSIVDEAPATVQEPEPPREPRVPRVILEVGSDFIAVVHNDGARGGLVVLTHHPNRGEKAKPVLEKAFQDKTTVLGLVTGVIKGGVEVDVDGLRAFAPGSHVDLRLGADLFHLVAKRLPFFVTQYAKRGRDVVLSRRSLIEEEAKKARAEALARLKVGEELDGVVRSVVPFGAFVDVGGIEGLVPLQEMSHNRADGPSDIFKAGEPTRVTVIKIDDRGKVWLSRKATIADPWQKVAQKYAHGTRHTGKVVRLQPFGAFVELESGVDGLIHTQDLSIKRIESPSDVVKVGDTIEVVVAHLDPAQHKIALHPAPQGDQVNEAPQRVAPHKALKAKIVAIESGGLVVRVLGVTGRNARGYITSAGTATPRGTELRKAFTVGQEVEAKVIEVDPRRGEVKLSIKALSEEQERSAYQQYRQQLKAEARFTLADLITKKSSPR